MSLSLVLTAMCLVALVATLRASARGSARGRYVAKPLASLAFVLLAVTGGALSGASAPYGVLITVGLVLGALGDVALMLPGRRPFTIGLAAFLLGHLAYVAAFALVTPISGWFGDWALVPVAAGLGALLWLWPYLGSMRPPVTAYVVVITVMVVGALAVLGDGERAYLDHRHAVMAAAGAALFFASDLAVARERFVASSFGNRLWGLPAYYIGQLLLAWSALGG
jgi:uncharacterized membrane protein YhhN